MWVIHFYREKCPTRPNLLGNAAYAPAWRGKDERKEKIVPQWSSVQRRWACPNLVSMKVYAFLSLLDVLKPWGFIYYKPERVTENFEITTFSNIFVCNISLFSGFGTTRKSQFQRLFVVIHAANPGSINCLMTTILKKFEWEVFFFSFAFEKLDSLHKAWAGAS